MLFLKHIRVLSGAGLVLLIGTSFLECRPLLTEEQDTIGKFHFEVGSSIWQRTDKFGSPEAKYRSVAFPVWFKLGLHPKVDFGVTFLHVSQTLHSAGADFKGALNSRISPELKMVLPKNFGLKLVWHTKENEKTNETLPLGAGTDLEAVVLYKAPTRWPSYLNLGYVKRGRYESSFGVESVSQGSFDPGDYWHCSAAIEIPLIHKVSFLAESVYYDIASSKYKNSVVDNTSGDAADALIGVTWSYQQQWNIQAGVAFGLLNERHTSFDSSHGAGDSTVRFELSYRLKPSKPQK